MADFRNNHLNQSNHEILANKVYNAIVDGSDIDLKSKFKRDLYSQKQIKEKHNPDGKLDWLNDNWGNDSKDGYGAKAHLTDDGQYKKESKSRMGV